MDVVDVVGQIVTYGNRRPDAAFEAELDKVKVNKINPSAPYPESSTGKTWWQKFQQRFKERRNIKSGGIVPDKGLNTRPKKCG
ncbi:hypothetical protein ACQV2B_17115 [Pantoea allii]|uniref:hypothetical protein n=1 Tax=Pantoea allii TaxID=574096 RepID=UPI003D31EF8A